MRFAFRDIPGLLRNPMGRRQLWISLCQRLWPITSRAAAVHRRTRAQSVRIVAVVGSFGKTTTARAVGGVLCGPDWRFRPGNCLSFLAGRVLRLRASDRYEVLEVGIDQCGQMAQYARMIRPDVAVVTSIGSEHHRSLGSLEVTREEKAEMVRALGPAGLAVLNGDDPNVRWMASQTRAKVVTFGLGEGNDVRATDASLADWPGTCFTLHAGGQSRPMRIRLMGPPGIRAALAGAAVGLAQGRSLDEIALALAALAPTTGRLEPVELPSGAVILRDEYKSALETIHTALDVLAQIPARRRIVILGEISESPGSQGQLYRDLGARVARVASRAIFVCGRYDTAYSAGAAAAGMPRSEIVKGGRDIFAVAERLRDELGPGDVVLIKGRDNQRLERITLLLQGRAVGCRIPSCKSQGAQCDHCPALERGWGSSKVMQFR